MHIIYGDILDVKEECILHQVNCMNKIGAGVSGAIIDKYPVVEMWYHYRFENRQPDELFGYCDYLQINDYLIIANSFSQFFYGNGQIENICYTDYDKLFANIRDALNLFDKVYVPYKIGCGLAGGNWDICMAEFQKPMYKNLYIVKKF